MGEVINGLILISFTCCIYFLYRFPPWCLFSRVLGCKLGAEFGDISPKVILFYFVGMGGGGGVRQVIFVMGLADMAEEVGSGPWYHDVFLERTGLCVEALLYFILMKLAEKFQVFGVAVETILVLFEHEGGGVVQPIQIE